MKQAERWQMSKLKVFAYTLLVCIPTWLSLSGCGDKQDTTTGSSSSATADDDGSMEVPTVEMPEDEAGDADSSADDDGMSDR